MPRGVPKSYTARQRTLSPERAREMREKLQAQLRELEQQDAQRYALIGRAISEHAAADPGFAETLQSILDQRVTDRDERVRLGLTTARRGQRGQGADVIEATDEVALTMTGMQP